MGELYAEVAALNVIQHTAPCDGHRGLPGGIDVRLNTLS